MALLSDYTAGTVTVSAGGTAVTGVGTAWDAAGFQEGDWFIAPGWSAIIASVNSNTSLTLYPSGVRGAALAGSPYRLRYMSDGSRVSAQARQLINALGSSGNLQALGGLSAVANQLPYFTGAGTMAVTPLTAFARTLLDDANAAAAASTLGLSAVTANTTVVANANAITASGFYFLASPFSNGPTSTFHLIEHIQSAATTAQQTAHNYVAGTTYFRYQSSGTWSPWRALFDSGSNANGSYVRFADGTQLCWIPTIATSTTATATWTYPAVFSASPTQFATSNATVAGAVRVATIGGSSTTSANVQVVNESGTRLASSAGCLAIGRWF